jgi:hypothetical protein
MSVTIHNDGTAPDFAPAAATGLPPGTIMDAKGRRLVLRELTIMEEMDLHVAMGDEACGNRLVLMRCTMASRVGSIDDEIIVAPATPAEFRLMMTKVGREGIDAVYSHDVGEMKAAQDLAKAKK